MPICKIANKYPTGCDEFQGCIIQESMTTASNPSGELLYQTVVLDVAMSYPDCNHGCCKYLLDGEGVDSGTFNVTFSSIHAVGYDGYRIFHNCIQFLDLGIQGAWCADSTDSSPFVQTVFDREVNVTGIVTGERGMKTYGLQTYSQWITSYTVGLFEDGVGWYPYRESGVRVVFEANDGSYVPKMNFFNSSRRVRGIRVHPRDKYQYFCFRFDIIGCF